MSAVFRPPCFVGCEDKNSTCALGPRRGLDGRGSEGYQGSFWAAALLGAEEKRQILEQTLSSSWSVASLARQHGVNANQLFYWRKLYRAGQLLSPCAIEQFPSHTLVSPIPLSNRFVSGFLA